MCIRDRVIICSVFYCALMDSTSLSFLSGRFFTYLGKISYGVYLLHYSVIDSVKNFNGSGLVKTVFAFLAVILISHLSFYLFEKPSNNLVRRLGQ